jgi:hypothetical protein
VLCRFARTLYNLHQLSGLRPRGFQSLMLILWKNNRLIILAAVKTNASITGRTDVFGKSDYFVNAVGYFIEAMGTYIFC